MQFIVHFFAAICLDLPPLSNGTITYSPTSSAWRKGTTATYSCGNGYVLSGGTVRTCQSDGTWSGETIVCERKRIFFTCAGPVQRHIFFAYCKLYYAMLILSIILFSMLQINEPFAL